MAIRFFSFAYTFQGDIDVPPGESSSTIGTDGHSWHPPRCSGRSPELALYSADGRAIASADLGIEAGGGAVRIRRARYRHFRDDVLRVLTAVLALARHRLSPHRWNRGFRFLLLGLGLGLSLIFAFSVARALVPHPSTCARIMIISTAALFVLGSLTPRPPIYRDAIERSHRRAPTWLPSPTLTDAAAGIAELLPGYELGAELEDGASGVVFEGRHRELGRRVAIKQLRSVFGEDLAVRTRFAREARVLAKLDHRTSTPSTTRTAGWPLPSRHGAAHRRYGLVTPDDHGLPARPCLAVALATCSALQFAHDHGVLHRDIKPDNLLFAGTGLLKITDFGIAKVLGGGETLATRRGDVLGTPAYMAPEQALAKEPTPATDVYSTGIMLYELLSAQLPLYVRAGRS